MIWFRTSDWNIHRINSFEIVISCLVDSMSSNLRMSRISIFEWRQLQIVFIRFTSSLYSLWELVDYVLTDSEYVHDSRSSSSISIDLLSHDYRLRKSNKLLKWHITFTRSEIFLSVWSNNVYKMYFNQCLQNKKI